jgi:hypothetical protein
MTIIIVSHIYSIMINRVCFVIQGLVIKPYMLFDNTRLIRQCDDDEKDDHHHDTPADVDKQEEEEEEEERKLRQQGLTPCEIAAQKLK